MRILFVSGELTGSALCQKLIAEGNEVKLFILRPAWKDCYTGLAEKTDDWEKELSWVGREGLIVFDDVAFGMKQDELRHNGFTVVGSSQGGDILEHDRAYFQEVLASYGIPNLNSYKFDTTEEAIRFVEHHPDRWVVKQTSHMSALNFVSSSKTGEDTLRVLRQYKKRGITPVHLQKYVEGIEVGVARYFNGTDWVGPIEINHEHKRLHEGDRGPLTPEMGTILWYTDEQIRLFTETLGRLQPHLREINFRGDFDINFIVNEEGAWPLEATPRFGCPSTEIQIELHTSPWTDFLMHVGQGKPYPLTHHTGFGIAVSVVCAPFPYMDDARDTRILGKEPKRITFPPHHEDGKSFIHFEEISRDEKGYYWSGSYGLLFHVTAHADTIDEAQRRVYKRVEKIHGTGLYWRKDIGERVRTHDIPTLKKWGWL